MRDLGSRATDTIAVPLTRDPTNRRLPTGLGAEPIVADTLDGGVLLSAVDQLAADAVIHKVRPTR